ncbi:hypothetical protein [uncultured Desulfosarcina sp.]|uniref:hypothetical protein n=1 Tax=uncultured Desulfosarcina sp. TaxID=218289 RepID=UPI0029C8A59E|nr:hypothetical protein [uncultured Desulfosarcina sp.]
MALSLVSILVLTGCASVDLHRFEKHADQGDYQWIAGQSVACTQASDTCGQLHLTKGDACLRLAKSGQTPAVHYRRAAEALATGLVLRQSWPSPAERQRLQENLCEALQGLQELQSGEAAEKTLARLVEAAETLYQLAPESVPAVYYLAMARLRQVQPELPDLNAARRLPVCNRLKRALNRVLSTMASARQSQSQQWERYAQNYQRLSFDLGAAIRTAECYKMQ